MRLIVRLVLQLVGITLICLTLTAGWVTPQISAAREKLFSFATAIRNSSLSITT